MRTFVILIMLMNVGYFVWSQMRHAEGVNEISAKSGVFMAADQSLILLAELPPESMPVAERREVDAESVEQVVASNEQVEQSKLLPAEAPQPLCYIASGFAGQVEADGFVAQIGGIGVAGSIDVRQEQISSTWWVHLPPFKSQVEAQSVIDELVAKGIDNFYMRTGELAGGISLGVFSREQSATTAQSEFLDRGYKASIKEIPRYVPKAYVMVRMADALLSETIEWKAFLAKNPKLELTEKLCETIAR